MNCHILYKNFFLCRQQYNNASFSLGTLCPPNQSLGGFFQTHDVMPTGKIQCSNRSLKTCPLALHYIAAKGGLERMALALITPFRLSPYTHSWRKPLATRSL